MKDILNGLDNLVSSFMEPVKDFIINGLELVIGFLENNSGMLFTLMFVILFVVLICVFGIFRFMKKAFGLFFVLLLIIALLITLSVIFG